jgi:hypothetical protein
VNMSIKQNVVRIDAPRLSARQMRALGIAAATVANVVILTIGRAVAGEFPNVTQGGNDQTVGFAQVVVVTALAGLVAWGLLALLQRWTSRATAIWTAIAVVAFAVSLLGPLGSGVGASSKVVLACMHVAAAATLFPLMRRSAGMSRHA